MGLVREGTKVVIELNDDEPVNGFRPSADVLYDYCADIYGANVLALIMTGMGNDGTRSLKKIKDKGGFVMAQDEESSVVWGMPGSAISAGVVDKVVALQDFPQAISKLL
ncbi:MAG: chemotaxis protein CheB [Planctomycetes bacterium]|nr:chemotaxis protein CheB [Planctomycetota bacterium]